MDAPTGMQFKYVQSFESTSNCRALNSSQSMAHSTASNTLQDTAVADWLHDSCTGLATSPSLLGLCPLTPLPGQFERQVTKSEL